eukprot:CAMPEP_0115555370 /NCGR_PEP_ID=MMETSP0271-20121206/97791_1 /TAXON_ID=71861 /ORGANISM="Scrippsiella trochoidea, Strain CCMP3099" /LENGTH=36 /DNA_ID= /DNA_START= /DNA_END= /DNA_ORIENTATION=
MATSLPQVTRSVTSKRSLLRRPLGRAGAPPKKVVAL